MVRLSVCSELDYFGLYVGSLALGETHPDLLTPLARDLYECFRNASNCEGFYACASGGQIRECVLSGWEDRCEGDTAVTCAARPDGSGFEYRTNCSKLGLNKKCLISANLQAICGSGSCGEYAVVTDSICDGDTWLSCHDGVEQKVDCQEYDLKCVFASDSSDSITSSSVGCMTGKTCERDRCDGDLVYSCNHGYEALPVDCRTIADGLTCVEIAASADAEASTACVAPEANSECTSGDGMCVGDLLRFCAAGSWIELDCSTFRGATCEVIEGGFLSDNVRCTTLGF